MDQQKFKEVLTGKDNELAALTKEFKQVNAAIKHKTVLKADTIFIPFNKPLDSLLRFERHGIKSG